MQKNRRLAWIIARIADFARQVRGSGTRSIRQMIGRAALCIQSFRKRFSHFRLPHKMSEQKRTLVILVAILVITLSSIRVRDSLKRADIPEAERPLAFSQEWETLSLPFAMPPVQLFIFPDRTCSIDQYGAINDGETSNTQAIAIAIDDCARQGGGTVAIPAGKWLTGPIRLQSNIRLDIAEGAEVLFSQTFSDYLPVVFSRYEGMEYYNYSPLIYARDCHDIAITGKGTLNGRGEAWWSWQKRQLAAVKKLYRMSDINIPTEERVFGTEAAGLRPSFVQFVNCTRIELTGFTIKNGPMWTIHPIYSDTILIQGVTVTTEGPNNDGIVIDSSRNALIENVRLDTSDDAIVIKSGLDRGGQRVGKPSENIVIRDCSIGRGNSGIAIGSEMSGDVRNVFVSRCDFDGTKRGLRVKSAPGRGGIVENVWAEDIAMKNIQAEAIQIDASYDSKNLIRPTTANLPLFRNFFFKDIECLQADTAISIIGATNSPIQNLSFKNIRMRSERSIVLQDVNGIRFENADIQTRQRPLISASNVQNAVFSALEHPPTYRPFVLIEGSRSSDIRFRSGYPAKAVRLGREVDRATVSYAGE